jgi:leader peptidase (prepilin peptidase)/N-methyltransferase
MLTKIAIFILGSIIGSFLSVLITRIESGKKGILNGRSECPHCNKTLQWFDLIPILSFILLKGKCRYCQKAISYFYPALEIITGLVFLLTYLKFSNSPTLTAVWLIIFSLSIAIAFYDAKTQEVPTKLSIPLIAISIILSLLYLPVSIYDSIQGAILGFGFFYLQYFFSKGKWTGLGDADIGLIIGILLGPLLLIQTLLSAYMLGALFGILLILTKNKTLQSKIAFGPFLILALILNVIYQTQLSALIFPVL